MRILTAEVQEPYLCLEFADIGEAMRFAYSFQEGDYEIVPKKKKRSLDANAYAWLIIDKMAERLRLPKSDIYRNAIKEIGGNTEIYKGKTGAIRKLAQNWETRGLGWQATVTDMGEYSLVCLYYGSSSFDTHEMSVFIDHLVQDAQALGIETKPQEYIDSLLERWKSDD